MFASGGRVVGLGAGAGAGIGVGAGVRLGAGATADVFVGAVDAVGGLACHGTLSGLHVFAGHCEPYNQLLASFLFLMLPVVF